VPEFRGAIPVFFSNYLLLIVIKYRAKHKTLIQLTI